jgi:hypothetical protein
MRARVSRGFLSPGAWTVAIILTGGAGTAAAQNVMVKGGTPGMPLEVVLNDKAVGSATISPEGTATVPLNLLANAGKQEIDASVEIESCKEMLRVLVTERGSVGMPPQPDCTRQPITGLYLVRRATTLVVDTGGRATTLMLLQRPPGSRQGWAPAPSGLMVFGGGGLAKFGEAAQIACGSAPSCSGDGYGAGYAAGVEFWPLRFAGVEAAFVRPMEVTTTGSGTSYRFESALDSHVITVSGKGGIPIGPVRIYGRVGTNYHKAVVTTSQTYDERTITVDGVAQTIPGGTQSSATETSGWSWAFGGGVDLWVSSWLAFYGDVGQTSIKGEVKDAEGLIDDRLRTYTFGARVRIGGK